MVTHQPTPTDPGRWSRRLALTPAHGEGILARLAAALHQVESAGDR